MSKDVKNHKREIIGLGGLGIEIEQEMRQASKQKRLIME